MADIVFRYKEMEKAAQDIKDLATKYKTASDTFASSFTDAVQNWEGSSKDAMLRFITGPVSEYTGVTIPKLLDSLAELLLANAKQMASADDQIAQNIPTSLGNQ